MPLSTRGLVLLTFADNEDDDIGYASLRRMELKNVTAGRNNAPMNLPPTRNNYTIPNRPTLSYIARADPDRKCRKTWLPSSGGTGMMLKTASRMLINMEE